MASINMDCYRQTAQNNNTTKTSTFIDCNNQERDNSEGINDLSIALTSIEKKKSFTPLITERRVQEITSQFNLLLQNRKTDTLLHELQTYNTEDTTLWPEWQTDGKFNEDLFSGCSFFCSTQKISCTRELVAKLLSIKSLQDNGEFNVRLFKSMIIQYKKDQSLSQKESFSQIVYHIQQSNKDWSEWIINGEFNQEFYISTHVRFYAQQQNVTSEEVRLIRQHTIDSQNYKWNVNEFCECNKRIIREKILGHDFDTQKMNVEKTWGEFYINLTFNLPFFDYSYILLFLLNRPFIQINIAYLRDIARFNRQEKFDVALFCRFVNAYKNDVQRMHSEDDFMQFLEEVSDDDLPNLPAGVALDLDIDKTKDENIQSSLTQLPFDSSFDIFWPEWRVNHRFNMQFYLHICKIFTQKKQTITQLKLRHIRQLEFFLSNGQFDIKEFNDFFSVYFSSASIIKSFLISPDNDSNNLKSWPEFYIDNKFNQRFFDHARTLLVLLKRPLLRSNIKYLLDIDRFHYRGKFDIDLFCWWVTMYKNNTHRIHSMDDFIQFLKVVPLEENAREKTKFSSSQNKIGTLTLSVDGVSNVFVEEFPSNSQEREPFDTSNDTTWPEWKINGQFNQQFYANVHMLLNDKKQSITPLIVSRIRHSKNFLKNDEFNVDNFCDFVHRYFLCENLLNEDIILPSDDITNWPELHIDNQFHQKFFNHAYELLGMLKQPFFAINIRHLRNLDRFNYHGKFDVDLFCHLVTAYKNSNRHIRSKEDFQQFLKEERTDFNEL